MKREVRTTDARQGNTGMRVRYILLISFALTALAFVIAYAVVL